MPRTEKEPQSEPPAPKCLYCGKVMYSDPESPFFKCYAHPQYQISKSLFTPPAPPTPNR